jgi:hypothetical protein
MRPAGTDSARQQRFRSGHKLQAIRCLYPMSSRQIRHCGESAEVDGCETTGAADAASAEVISPLAASSSAAPTTFSPIRIRCSSSGRRTAITGAKDTTAIYYTTAAFRSLHKRRARVSRCLRQMKVGEMSRPREAIFGEVFRTGLDPENSGRICSPVTAANGALHYLWRG